MAVQTENLGGTVGEVRKREADILYGLVLLFTYGQMALIVFDMLALIPGFVELTGLKNAGNIHSFGELTTAYLTFLCAYIGRNAWQKYKGLEDADKVPAYVFLRIQRGYFYLGLWGTLCFSAYMLKGLALISRMPQELMITTMGVMAALFGDKAIKGFLDKRATSQLKADSASSDNRGAIMAYVETRGRLTNKECREITGLGDSQSTFLLAALEKEGLLEQVNQGRYAYYRKKGTSN